MSITVHDFFRPLHLHHKPSEQDYEKVRPFIQFAESVSLLANQAIYLVDYYKRNFAYVSDKPVFLCGRTATEVRREGFLFYLKHVPSEDVDMLLKVNEAGFAFYRSLPVHDRLDYSISYDFHLKQRMGELLLVNHQLTPLLLDKDFNIWIALCIVSISSRAAAGNVKIRKRNGQKEYVLDLQGKGWIEAPAVRLGRREKEVLALTVQGNTVQQIAVRLGRSIDTVKFHKKNLFRKLEAKNGAEAITAAVNRSLI